MFGLATKWRNVSFSLWVRLIKRGLSFRDLKDVSLLPSLPTVGPSAVQRLDSSTVRTYSCWEEEQRDLKLYAVCNTTQILALSTFLLRNLKQILEETEERQLLPKISVFVPPAWPASAEPGSCDKVIEDSGASSEPWSKKKKKDESAIVQALEICFKRLMSPVPYQQSTKFFTRLFKAPKNRTFPDYKVNLPQFRSQLFSLYCQVQRKSDFSQVFALMCFVTALSLFICTEVKSVEVATRCKRELQRDYWVLLWVYCSAWKVQVDKRRTDFCDVTHSWPTPSIINHIWELQPEFSHFGIISTKQGTQRIWTLNI